MKRLLLILIGAVLVAKCGGSPTAPASVSTGQLEGEWAGTLMLVVDGITTTNPVSVTFRTVPDTGTIGYRSTVRVSGSPLLGESTGDTSTGWPGTPPTTVQLNHNYTARSGACRGSFNASGQQESARHLEADVLVIEVCGQSGHGRLMLDRR